MPAKLFIGCFYLRAFEAYATLFHNFYEDLLNRSILFIYSPFVNLMAPEAIFFIIIFLYSVIAHEVAHGKMAELLGDPTARLAGRLTLNPIPHIDPIGSIALPALLLITGSPILFGWAKPVPYNPYNIRHRYGDALVAGAGVATNLLLAVVFGLFIRFLDLDASFFQTFNYIVSINLVLGIFNLVPIPPLDGSKILFDFLPNSPIKETLEQYGFVILIFFVLYGFSYLSPLIDKLFWIITGTNFFI